MSRNIWIGLAVVLVILGGWYFIQSRKTQPTASPVTPAQSETMPADNSATTSASPETMDKKVVTISSSGFSPKDITVKVGESVVWINSDSVVHTVNSDPHPTHTIFQPLNQVGRIQASEEKSLKFDSAGTYKYHDHLNPSLVGSVTVQ